jgi:hypothetical protein
VFSARDRPFTAMFQGSYTSGGPFDGKARGEAVAGRIGVIFRGSIGTSNISDVTRNG